MIVNKSAQDNNMHTDETRQVDSPPSYDELANEGNLPSKPPVDAKQQQEQQPAPSMGPTQPYYTIAGPSYTTQEPVVYNYVNPHTGELVRSFLPPDHPAMICLQEGKHLPETQFGLLGILAAVFWFPLGIGLCLLDRKVKCKRCNEALN